MSQSDYIKYLKSATVANNKSDFPLYPGSDEYLNNQQFYLENNTQNTATKHNQLQLPTTRRVFGMELNSSTYTNCITNSGNLYCYPKANYAVPTYVGVQLKANVYVSPKHTDCIFVSDNVYCNGARNLKPIDYANPIHYSKFTRTVDPKSSAKKTIRIGMGKMFQSLP